MLKLSEIQNIYFIGIGGIGMSAIAKYFCLNGKKVAGYDKVPTAITKSLEAIGVEIHFEDDVRLIPTVFKNKAETLVVYTPAIPKTHTELVFFLANDYHTVKRSQILGEITKNTFCLAVAGTHGKTTTSAILGHIMKECGTQATSFLGGVAENYNSNLILGEDKVTVVEADEFDRSFLRLSPNVAAITSMDADHLDIYGRKSALEASFIAFSEKVAGQLVVAKGLPLEGLTYAVESEADYEAKDVVIENGAYNFNIVTPNNTVNNVRFSLPGKHNLSNALAAFALADQYGVDLEQAKEALSSFKGIKRRFSYKINRPDFVLIDDYAHHPTEINAVVDAVRELYPNEEIMAVFQPHLFSRTKDFVEDFAASLSKFDELLLLDIYPARELPIPGIDSQWLLDKITLENKQLISKEAIFSKVLDTDAKVVVMIGAGDIGELIEEVSEKLRYNLSH